MNKRTKKKLQPKKLAKHHKLALIIGGSIGLDIAVFLVIFFGLANGSFAKINIGSLPVKADISKQELQQKLESANSDYRISLEFPDGIKKEFPLSEVGISINSSASAKSAKEYINNSLPQRLRFWQPINIRLITISDEKTLNYFIATQATKANVAAKNAELSLAEGKASIVPEVVGDGITLVNAPLQISGSVETLSFKPLKIVQSKLVPSISAKDLESSQAEAQKLLDQKVVFKLNTQFIRPNSGDIARWLDLSPIEKDKTVDVTVNSGKIAEYIEEIGEYYAQPPRSRLISKTAEGEIVLDNGASGYVVVSKDETATKIAQQIMDGKGAEASLSLQYSSAKTVEVQPHEKWIVVDVTTKRMYAYEQTNLVKSFLVSAGAPSTPTVLGQYAIYSKHRSQDMRGANADGSRYFQPNVEYVNYFYKDYAIHGNYWRPTSYFGNINSSHGCVGIVNLDAKWIHDWAPIGTPVFTHI